MPDGAYYLSGYAVECALKACIAKQYAAEAWPERDFVAKCHTHNVMELVRLAGLESEHSSAVRANLALGTNWNIVKDWSERSRYERHSLTKAQRLLGAITDTVNGVLPWIQARW